MESVDSCEGDAIAEPSAHVCQLLFGALQHQLDRTIHAVANPPCDALRPCVADAGISVPDDLDTTYCFYQPGFNRFTLIAIVHVRSSSTKLSAFPAGVPARRKYRALLENAG